MSECNVANRTIFCDDNLDVLRGINSDCIDLIYLDPPFNKNKEFTAPIGSSAEGASFKDIFREDDLKDEWLQTIREDSPDLFHYLNGIKGIGKPYNFAYLAYMAIRLTECRRLLKNTGSLYLHCDQTISHYLKTLLDCIFGEQNFRNEIIWQKNDNRAKGSQHKPKRYGTQTDSIFFYSKSKNAALLPHVELAGKDVEIEFPKLDKNGKRYKTGIPIWRQPSMGPRPNLCYTWRGFTNPHSSGWRLRKERMEDEYQKGNIVIIDERKLERRLYHENYDGKPLGDLWTDISPAKGKQRTDYPTQKPLALLERIIKASSNEGDIVLDPFCGCATTCVAAEKLDREWIGIDISVKAYDLVRERLQKEVANPEDYFKYQNIIHMRTDPPKRTDQDSDHRERKFVYVISHPNYEKEYKVGIAKDWKSRLNSYQTSDPDRQYKIEFKMETPWFRETEKYIHDEFTNKHEWVQGELEKIIQSIKDYKPVYDKQTTLDI